MGHAGTPFIPAQKATHVIPAHAGIHARGPPKVDPDLRRDDEGAGDAMGACPAPVNSSRPGSPQPSIFIACSRLRRMRVNDAASTPISS